MSSLFNINVHNGLTFSNDHSTLSVSAASGTDTEGKNLTIAAGQGTGTGFGGSIIFQTANGSDTSGSDANSLATAMTITDNGNVGIGTSSPSSILNVFESSTGTAAAVNGVGSLVIQHTGNGQSSIVFPSGQNIDSDYGFIQYTDDGALSGSSSTENGLLHIGVENDDSGDNIDDIHISSAGNSFYMTGDGNTIICPTNILALPENQFEIRGPLDGTPGTLTLSNGVTVDNTGTVYGKIAFKVPSEGSPVGNSVSASIEAISEGNFNGSNCPAALVFSTGNTAAATEKMRIDRLGNVGIGNPSPGSLMEISKVSGSASLELSSWSETATAAHASVLKFQKSGTATVNTFTAGNHTTAGEILGRLEAWGVNDSDSATLSSYIEFANDAVSDADSVPGKITFATSDSDDAGTPSVRMIIDDSGNVGIGTTSPNSNHKLHVDGRLLVSDNMSLVDDNRFIGFGVHYDGGWKHINSLSGYGGYIKLNSAGAFEFRTDDSQKNDGETFDNPSPRMIITNSGDVGIGTDNPGTKLHMVSGATDNFITLTSGGYNHTIGMYYNQLTLNAHGNATYGTIDFNINNGSTLGMRLNASGNLGIGTDDPKARLHVKSSQSNTSGGLENFNQVSLIIANSSDDNCALAMHTQDYALAFHFRDSEYGGTYFERGYIKGNQNVGQIDFTGQHKNLMNQNIDTTKVGLIVSATNNHINVDNSIIPKINESLPYCILSNTDNDKKVFGVISDKEDINNSREYSTGNFVSVYQKTNTNEQRFFINSLGEGAIWICNKNGTLENGDYITSTTVSGYGAKQTLNEGFLMNYTVAKITCDCNFSLTKIVKQKLKTLLDSENNKIIDYDINGDVQFEDDLDENGNQQMVYPLETRFLQEDGTLLVNEADYTTRLGNGESVYIACFVGCTYHCG